MDILREILNIRKLIWPELCIACYRQSPIRNEPFCLSCYLKLPFTDHFDNAENAFVKHFWGRVNIQHGAALYAMKKGSVVRDMIHHLKYRRKKQVGLVLGRIAGKRCHESSLFEEPDVIVPVPIHWKKKQQRGYNQAAYFARGLSEQLECPCLGDVLIKAEETGSQTQRTRSGRIDNVAHSFRLKDHHRLAGKHVLLVDDVITTGATLESCAWRIEDIPGVKISMLTMAIARQI